MTQSRERVIAVKGSLYDRAFSQGFHFRQRFDELIATLKHVPLVFPLVQKFIPHRVYKTLVWKIGSDHLYHHKGYLEEFSRSNLYEGLQGLAKGFGVSENLIYGLNCFETISSKLPFSLGCTSLAFGALHTEDGVEKIAYNHDFPLAFAPYLFLRHSSPARGYKSLAIAYQPILGAIAGINETGLGISLNHAYISKLSLKPAIPNTMLVQECLTHCRDAQEALNLIDMTSVPNGALITLIDTKGMRLAVELSPKEKATRSAGKKILHTFNYAQSRSIKVYQVPDEAWGKMQLKGRKIHAHSFHREKRYLDIVDEKKKYADDAIHKLMSDHAYSDGAYDTICRHDAKVVDTILSAILSPGQKSIKIIFGHACEGSYREYVL